MRVQWCNNHVCGKVIEVIIDLGHIKTKDETFDILTKTLREVGKKRGVHDINMCLKGDF